MSHREKERERARARERARKRARVSERKRERERARAPTREPERLRPSMSAHKPSKRIPTSSNCPCHRRATRSVRLRGRASSSHTRARNSCTMADAHRSAMEATCSTSSSGVTSTGRSGVFPLCASSSSARCATRARASRARARRPRGHAGGASRGSRGSRPGRGAAGSGGAARSGAVHAAPSPTTHASATSARASSGHCGPHIGYCPTAGASTLREDRPTGKTHEHTSRTEDIQGAFQISRSLLCGARGGQAGTPTAAARSRRLRAQAVAALSCVLRRRWAVATSAGREREPGSRRHI